MSHCDAIEEHVALLAQAAEAANRTPHTKEEIYRRLSARFASILEQFRLPKLSLPRIEKDYVPWVRGSPYREIGSAGALTLLSVAWALSIFEEALTSEFPHPGFLIIDSPQKNLAAGTTEEDLQDPSIIEGMYTRFLSIASEWLGQLIIVDNNPPSAAREHVVVQYTRDPERPPYGLIDDEIGAANA